MKKLSHLFLFVVLLNATSNAQTTQHDNEPVSSPGGLRWVSSAALRGLSQFAIFLTPITLTPMTPEASAPALRYQPATSPKVEAAPAKSGNQEVAYAGSMALAATPIAGRGVRSSAPKGLNGQTTGDARIDRIIVDAATRHGVEPLLLFSVMNQESAFNSQAVSPKGARGLMQLMPATATRFGVTNIFDPEQNIHAGARYLRFLLDLFDGDVRLALAGYNAGEGAVKKYGYSIPPYPETINYVRKITRRYATLSNLSE